MNDLTKIIFANPGDHCSQKHELTIKGCGQVVGIIGDLSHEIHIGTTIVVTSTTRYAYKTALILGDSFVLPVEQSVSLKQKSLATVREKAINILKITETYCDINTVIIVGHAKDRYLLVRELFILYKLNPGFIPFGFGMLSPEGAATVYNGLSKKYQIIETNELTYV